MTKEELLVPRYKVIAAFPAMDNYMVKVGDILIDEYPKAVRNQDGYAIVAFEWDLFPHLFRKLEWWEDRKLEDFSHLKHNQNKKVYEIEYLNIVQGKAYDINGKFLRLSQCLPATLEEYTAYITSKQ